MAKIIDTIRALLAKAASTEFEAEAEVFLAKAHELLEKHQLCEDDLESDDPIDGQDMYPRNNPDGVDWDFSLLFPLASYFGCRAIKVQNSRKPFNKMNVVGRESARITVEEMHLYLIKTVRRLGREAAKNQTMKLYKKHPYKAGYMVWTGDFLNADQCARRIGNALAERIWILVAAEERRNATPTTPSGKNALITLDRVNAVFQRLHPDAVNFGGQVLIGDKAREIANGIGLHRQTGGSAGTKLLG